MTAVSLANALLRMWQLVLLECKPALLELQDKIVQWGYPSSCGTGIS